MLLNIMMVERQWPLNIVNTDSPRFKTVGLKTTKRGNCAPFLCEKALSYGGAEVVRFSLVLLHLDTRIEIPPPAAIEVSITSNWSSQKMSVKVSSC